MALKKKEPNSSDGEGSNIQNILDGLVDKVKVKKLTDNITEQMSAVCNAIVKSAGADGIFFNSPSIYVGKKWMKLDHNLLSSFLINTAIKLRIDEDKITTTRNENGLLRQFNKISKRKTNEEFRNSSSRIKELPTIKNNRIKLKYPIICVGKGTYQEKSPGLLKEWSVQHAVNKYGEEVKKHFEHYIGFTCMPSHINYERVINDEYNKYKKLSHGETEGDWHNIKALIEHIFGEGEGFRMGMEYMWNLYMNPTQELPFIGLNSEKKGTGKSTFLRFLRAVFEQNVSVVSAVDFKSSFNDHYVHSLVLISDEHAEGNDRKIIAQRMKMYVTEKTIRAEAKFVGAYTTEKYFKIVFAGNDEEMMTFIEPENTRYWIIRVPSIQSKIEKFDDILKKEIPAFLHYLRYKFKARPSRDRLYFSPKEFQTEAGSLIQDNSRSKLHKTIHAHLKNLFEKYEVDVIFYDPKTLLEDLKLPLSKIDYIRKVLKNEMKLEHEGNTRQDIGCRIYEKQALDDNDNDDSDSDSTSYSKYNLPVKDQGKFYTFKKVNFISNPAIYKDLGGNMITEKENDAELKRLGLNP